MEPRRSAIGISTIAYVLGMAAHTTFLFFLVPVYAAQHDVASAQAIAYGAQAASATIVGLAAGRLADRVPRRRVMRLGWGLIALGALALALVPRPLTALYASSILMGAGLSYGFVAFQSYLADLLTHNGITNGYARTGAIALLGSALGPLVAGRILASAGDATASLFVAALAIAGLLLTLLLTRIPRVERIPAGGPRIGFASAALGSFRLRRTDVPSTGAAPYVLALALLGVGYGASVPWMGPYLLDAHQIPPGQLGTLVAVATALGGLGILAAGAIGTRLQRALPLALATNILLAASLVGFAFAPSIAIASAFFVVRHFAGNPTGSILNAGLTRATEPEARGSALGAATLAWNLPWAIGALVGGALRGAWDGWLFVASAIVVVLGPLAGMALQRRLRERGAARRPRGARRGRATRAKA